MSFLDEISRALTGASYEGIGPTIGNVAESLGGSGQGILGNVGRLGLLLSARSPSEAAGLVSQWADEDRQRRMHLSILAAQGATPQEAEQATGYYPPTQQGVVSTVPGKKPSYTGGTAKIVEQIKAPPLTPDVQAKFMQSQNIVERALAAANEPAKQAQILGNPPSFDENQSFINQGFELLKKNIPNFSEDNFYIGGQISRDGNFIPTIERRPDDVMPESMMSEWLARHPMPADYQPFVEYRGMNAAGTEPMVSFRPLPTREERIPREVNPIHEIIARNWAIAQREGGGDPLKTGKFFNELMMAYGLQHPEREVREAGIKPWQRSAAKELGVASWTDLSPEDMIALEESYNLSTKPSMAPASIQEKKARAAGEESSFVKTIRKLKPKYAGGKGVAAQESVVQNQLDPEAVLNNLPVILSRLQSAKPEEKRVILPKLQILIASSQRSPEEKKQIATTVASALEPQEALDFLQYFGMGSMAPSTVPLPRVQ